MVSFCSCLGVAPAASSDQPESGITGSRSLRDMPRNSAITAPVAAGDGDVIEAGAAAVRAALRGRCKDISSASRLQEIDLALLRHGDDVVGIARMREGGVGKGEDGAAMGDGKAVHVLVLEPHLYDGIGRTSIEDLHAEGLRQVALADHRLGDGTRGFRIVAGGALGHHLIPLPVSRLRIRRTS